MDTCAFCKRTFDQLEHIISDPDEPICSDCLHACVDLLAGEAPEGWIITTSPQRCAYCGRRPTEGVRHCINVVTHSQRICERCVELAADALHVDTPTVEEQIRQMIEEELESRETTIDDDIQSALRSISGPIPERLHHPMGVLFDFGGTLLRATDFDRGAGIRAVLELADRGKDQDVQDVIELFDELDAQIQDRRETSMIECTALARQRMVYDRLGIAFSVDPEEVQRTFWDAAYTYELEAGIVAALDDLARRDIPMAVLSNSAFSGSHLEHELARHELADYFQFVATSADYGLRKPHPFIFHTAAMRLGCHHAEAWYIGNSRYYDVEGAVTAGMGAVWYNPRSRNPQGPKPHASVVGWPAFSRLLASILDNE